MTEEREVNQSNDGKSKSPATGEKKLTLMELVWIGTGQVVGAGIVTIVGSALAATGYSAWFAYTAAVFFGLFRIMPHIFFYSSVVAPGGVYGFITRCVGKSVGGLVTISSLIGWTARGTAVVSIAKYITAMFPSVNTVAAGLIIWGFLALTNLGGIDVMAKLQSIATPTLLFCLVSFSILCMFNVQPGYMDFSSPEMFTNGASGWFAAVVLLCYSTNGHSGLANFAPRAENPKKNVPLALLITSGIILVLYTLVGWASGAVLPLSQTANGTLTSTAKALLPTPLYYAFMVGGPIFALLTTMNSGIMNSAFPVLAGVKEGWLPKFLVMQNKRGAYWVAIVIIFIVGCLPLSVGMSVTQITNFTLGLSALSSTLLIIAAFKFPKKYAKEWSESWIHCSNGVYYTFITLAALANGYIVLASLQNLTTGLAIINISIIALATLYGIWRMKTTKITETDYV